MSTNDLPPLSPIDISPIEWVGNLSAGDDDDETLTGIVKGVNQDDEKKDEEVKEDGTSGAVSALIEKNENLHGNSGDASVDADHSQGEVTQLVVEGLATLDEEVCVEPEKESFPFKINDSSSLTSEADMMIAIKKTAEQVIYHWKKLPLLPPEGIQADKVGGVRCLNDIVDENCAAELASKEKYGNLFLAPTFNELDQVAFDAKGLPKRLNSRQLDSIHKYGEFEVPSINFAGQSHRWRLSYLLQKGSRRAHEDLQKDKAHALKLLLITARDRIVSSKFSVVNGLQAILEGLWYLIDVLFGLPWTSSGDVQAKLNEEHENFLVAELNVKPSSKRNWRMFCKFAAEKTCESQFPENTLKKEYWMPPALPYHFVSPKGTHINLQLFNVTLCAQMMPIVTFILESEAKGWHLQYKDKMIIELINSNMTQKQMKMHINEAIHEEYFNRVCNALKKNLKLKELLPGLGSLLVDQAKASLLCTQAVQAINVKLGNIHDEHRELLLRSYPVRAKINEWLKEQLNKYSHELMVKEEWTAHTEAFEACRREGLYQASYFLQREHIFRRDREPVLLKELNRVKIPRRTFEFKRRLWFPQNWEVHRTFDRKNDTVPTIILDAPSGISKSHCNADEPYFTVIKHSYTKNSSLHPFWRWVNFMLRVYVYVLNAMFWLGIVVPWCSPVSFRALVCRDPFMPDYELSQVNGTLAPKKTSLTQTMISRLCNLWRHVRNARAKFESQPDTGFLGKTLTRHINRFWNYVLKGGVGSCAFVLIMPLLCLCASVVSVVLAVTSVFWVPAILLAVHVIFVVAYDFDHPLPKRFSRFVYIFMALFWYILTKGILQCIVAVLTAAILCPIASLFIALYAHVRRGIRFVWDGLMYRLLILKKGRIPAADTFMARRIAGPGLASNYMLQVKPEQALAAVEAYLEMQQLEAWDAKMRKIIDEPVSNYRSFVNRCFSSFSLGLDDEKGPFMDLKIETQNWHTRLHEITKARKKSLSTGLKVSLQEKIRLPSRELKSTLVQTAHILQAFYQEHIFLLLSESITDFWHSRNLEENDWTGLAHQILGEIFSPHFLCPLEETDTCFHLEVEHLNLERYAKMLQSGEYRDDLDVARSIQTPKGDIDVDLPHLDKKIFSTSSNFHPSVSPKRVGLKRWTFTGCQRYRQKNRAEFCKLDIPISLPTPATTSLLIYNRENDKSSISLSKSKPIINASDNLPISFCTGLLLVDQAAQSEPVSATNTDKRSMPEAVNVYVENESDNSCIV